jgi:hypothetical protein
MTIHKKLQALADFVVQANQPVRNDRANCLSAKKHIYLHLSSKFSHKKKKGRIYNKNCKLYFAEQPTCPLMLLMVNSVARQIACLQI